MKNLKSKIFLYFFLININLCFSQKSISDFGFIRNDSILIKKDSVNFFRNPWVGGLNSCQFSEIDLNNDGIKDLVIFDRVGNRLLPFINRGTSNKVDYDFAPEYIKKFPPIQDWMLLVPRRKEFTDDQINSLNAMAFAGYFLVMDERHLEQFSPVECLEQVTFPVSV